VDSWLAGWLGFLMAADSGMDESSAWQAFRCGMMVMDHNDDDMCIQVPFRSSGHSVAWHATHLKAEKQYMSVSPAAAGDFI
jgi:hypothetical protein